ncbi:MAG: glycogen/starch synthase [Bacteroidales bacterium]|nr:glycogen/starch synthase [Bacteroidales bacterium]MCF8389198.1 glycogen/starch synthase [Bacteroidales bacterium]
METTKVLFISQEISPYLPESEMSLIGRYLPQGIQEKGREIRTFMPRFGNINERRNQLHEVIRLSGMNLIIEDSDHPLIIKVASIQAARMQVYFIDNDDYFHRKTTVKTDKGKFHEDNDERMVFFARGVLETIKKLRWSPDIVHCHGWFTSLVPLYLKKSYADEPLFANSKVIFSAYNNSMNETFREVFLNKIKYEGIMDEDLKMMENPTFDKLTNFAFKYSDGVIRGSEKLSTTLEQQIKELKVPVLEYQDPENYIDEYSDFYDKILTE